MDRGPQGCLPLLGGHQLGIQPQVQQRATEVNLLIHLGGGAYGLQEREFVGPRVRGHALAGWLAVFSTVRCGPQYPTHGNIVGNPHERREERRVEDVLIRMDFLIKWFAFSMAMPSTALWSWGIPVPLPATPHSPPNWTEALLPAYPWCDEREAEKNPGN